MGGGTGKVVRPQARGAVLGWGLAYERAQGSETVCVWRLGLSLRPCYHEGFKEQGEGWDVAQW